MTDQLLRVLGESVLLEAFSIKGYVSESLCVDLTKKIIDKIGMTIVSDGSIVNYPTNGKGGWGYTLFQPIVESFIVWDVWPTIGGAYLFVCSCKNFLAEDVMGIVKHAGLKVRQRRSGSLSLRPYEEF